jgi:UDPglucose 6-dehydrogenase
MNITIVGTGYVGLVTGTCFAETGVSVTCVDINKEKIEQLNKGIVPIYEPGLDKMIKKNVEKKRLFFSTNIHEDLQDSEAIFIAVGTPPNEDGSADLKHVLNVAKEIGKHLDHYIVVVTKSTVPIGTAKKVKETIQNELNKKGASTDFDVASNPEFLKEGSAIEDFLKPERIIVGCESERAEKLIKRLYKPFLLNNHPIYFMDVPSAELTKYAANAMLATRISFMNDISNLCEILGADINAIRKGIGSDSRIGNKFLYPGTGYGGSCFPKDVKALINTGKTNSYSLEIIEAVEKINEKQKNILFNKIYKYFDGNLKGRVFAIWGLSFKPHTDDMREAPALTVIANLLKEGATINVYDPIAMDEAKKQLGTSVNYKDEPYEALQDAEALIVITEWPEFRILDYEEIKKRMKNQLIFDGRNIYEPNEMKDFGFTYFSIGREPVL